MLDIEIFIHAAHERNRLIPRPERPIRLDPLERRIQTRQRPRMAGPRVCRRLCRMTRRAGFRPGKMRLARSYPGQQAQHEDEAKRYQTSRPLNWICRPNTPAR